MLLYGLEASALTRKDESLPTVNFWDKAYGEQEEKEYTH